MKIDPNLSWADKLMRFFLGLGMLVLFFYVTSFWRYFLLFGVVLVVTSFINWCPVYYLLGISTLNKKKD